MLGPLGGKKTKGEIELPIEIIYEILARLPTDPLLNCKLVCKSWNSLINSAPFAQSHLECTLLARSSHKKTNDDLLLVHALGKLSDPSSGEFFTLGCDDISDHEYTKRLVIPIPEIIKSVINLNCFQSVGTCNGLICFVRYGSYNDDMPILLNPRVRKVLVLPTPRHFSDARVFCISYKLCYDSHNNDFKLLKLATPSTSPYEKQVHRIQLFSLRTFSWKDLDTPAHFIPYNRDNKPMEIFGALHWVCSKPSYEMNESASIVTFNLSTELFGKMELPKSVKKMKSWELRKCHKLNYRGSFAFLAQGAVKSDLWVMKEYGVAKSWTKVLTIRMGEDLELVPLYFTKSDRILLGTWLEGVVSIDPERKDVKEIVDDRLMISFLEPFFETLVLLDHSDALSY